ncbi:MAG: hypothetical protein LUF92_03685 [Clostridiales bacterium]|nr:hypothetical protein [Clostridiales bacterium]
MAYSNKDKKYIYNVLQANEIIQMGIPCVETGFNPRRKRFYWAFDREEIQRYYKENPRYIQQNK